MIGCRLWFAGVIGSMRRECRKWIASPGEIFFCDIMPLLWLLVVWGLLGNGVMTKVPVALVDEDKSSMSREVIRALDATRSLGLESMESGIAALDAMRAGDVYGVIVIPFGYMRDKLSGPGSSIVLYTDENRYAVAGMFEEAGTGVASALQDENLAVKIMQAGTGASGAKRILGLAHPDFYRLGNMASSFLIFLGSTLMPGLITIGATFAFMTAILREIWNKSAGEWLNSANGSFSAGLLGKLTPHFVFYCLVFLFYIALFSGASGFPPAGSIAVWFLAGAATIAVFAAMCILISAFSPTWSLALVIATGYAAPALPFSGFSIPLDAMDAGVRFFANFIPLTWYIRAQAQVLYMGAGSSEMGMTFPALALLFAAPLPIALPFFRRKFFRLAQSETEARRQ